MKQVIDTRYILKINNKLFYRKGAGGFSAVTLDAKQAREYFSKDVAIKEAKEIDATVYKLEIVMDVLEEE
ncbi:hypothetical protein [Staphylococcus rostri]|uniref:hypothetical protein n=1 Tax=Staphylococcus rostri TaxID=522262 RepID=UPI002852DA68|nr:hypothetical protein [Staphylococcus rostri]